MTKRNRLGRVSPRHRDRARRQGLGEHTGKRPTCPTHGVTMLPDLEHSEPWCLECSRGNPAPQSPRTEPDTSTPQGGPMIPSHPNTPLGPKGPGATGSVF